MKKLFIVTMFLAMATPALAWNLNIFGSDDKHKHRKHNRTTQTQPNDPVPVPEPATFILLVSGLVALAAYRIKK